MTANTPDRMRRFRGGGAGFADTADAPPAGQTVFIPLQLRRRGGRTVIEVPPDSAPTVPDARPNLKATNPALLGIARAFRWRARLESGEFATHRDLARHLGVGRSYVSRIMRLTLLAPDIIQAFIDGREPDGLSLDTLLHGDIPGDWPGQRRVLGFPDAL